MKRISLLLAALLVTGFCEKLSGEIQRIWTSSDGRKLTGTLEGQGEGWGILRVKGKIYELKLERAQPTRPGLSKDPRWH